MNADSDTATFSSTFANKIRFYTASTTGNTVFSKGVVERSWDANTATNHVPDFAVKVIAHESFEAVSDPNVFVRGANVLLDTTPHAKVKTTVASAFSSGTSTNLNLIDLLSLIHI